MMFALCWWEFIFVCLPQQIESRNKISSSLRNRLSEQAAERVSCAAVATNSRERRMRI